MLSINEQMDIIKTALSQGYKGPIYELIEQAIIQKQSQSPQQQQTPQVGTPALGGSFTEKQPPSSTERNIIKPGEYKKGGFKYENGGSHSDDFVEDGIESDYEDYMRDMMEAGKDPISLNEYERLSKGPYGKNLNDFYESKDGRTVMSYSSWENSSVKKAFPVNQVMGWSKSQQEKYYNTIYKDSEVASTVMEEDTKKYNEENPTEVTKDPMNGWTPEWSQKDYDDMENANWTNTPSSNPFNAANQEAFREVWNKSDRIKENYTFMDFIKGKEDKRTYKPRHYFANDWNSTSSKTGTNKVFYTDENGNPVGDSYTDGTRYSKELINRSGYNPDKSLSEVEGSAEELQGEAETTDDVLYKYIPAVVTAPTVGTGVGIVGKAALKHAVKPLLAAANTNLITGVAGTSTFDALNILGAAHLIQTAPENIQNMIEDPSWENSLNLGINALEAFGGKYTLGRISSNFKKVKNTSKLDVTNITKLNTVTNRPTTEVFTNSKIVADNITTGAPKIINTKNAINNLEGPPSGGVAPNNPIGSADDLSVELGTKYKHDLTRKALEDSQDFSKTNFSSAENKRLLDQLPLEQRANILKTNEQIINTDNVATINYGTNIKSTTYGQSGPKNVNTVGDRRILNDGTFLGLDEPIPRFSEVNINNLKLNIGDGVDESTKYYNKVRNITSHEIDHTKFMPTWGGVNKPGTVSSYFSNTSGNYNYNSKTRTFNIRPGYNENQLGVITQKGVVDFTTLHNIGPIQGGPTKYFSKFNPTTGTFNKVTDEGTRLEKLKTRFQAAISKPSIPSNDAVFKKQMQNRMYRDKENINTDRFDNFLHYFTEPHEMSAKMNGYKSQMNFGAKTHGNISGSQGKKLYDNLKLTDPAFWAVFKDDKAFTEMFKKVPYAATIPIGLGTQNNNSRKEDLDSRPEVKKKGGYRSNSSRQMLYNNRKPKK